MIPYTQGLGESIKKICKKYGIQTHFKGNRTIKKIFVKPKDKDPLHGKSGTIYWYQCGELVCDEEYIGEKSRTLWRDIKSIWKIPHPFMDTVTFQDITPILITSPPVREDHGLAQTIKESIYIRVNNPTLNRYVGKYNLHHIWDRVLFSTHELRISTDNGHVHRKPISGHVQSISTNRHAHRTIGHTGHARTP